MASFTEKLNRHKFSRSLLCIGLDPSRKVLEGWGLPPNPKGLQEFCNRMLEASLDLVSVIKPQSAFFEQFGYEGMEILSHTIRTIKAEGVACLLDCKRGDIGSTMEAYGLAMLGENSSFNADAMTATAYLGIDAMTPLFERAKQTATTIFVVVRSSNPEGAALQRAVFENGKSVAQNIAEKIGLHNRDSETNIVAGAVMGATLDAADNHDQQVISALENSWILAPGIGAQGGGFDNLAPLFGRKKLTMTLPAISRAAYAESGTVHDIRKLIRTNRDTALALLDN